MQPNNAQLTIRILSLDEMYCTNILLPEPIYVDDKRIYTFTSSKDEIRQYVTAIVPGYKHKHKHNSKLIGIWRSKALKQYKRSNSQLNLIKYINQH